MSTGGASAPHLPILYPPPNWPAGPDHCIILWHGCTSDDLVSMRNNGIDPTLGKIDVDFGRGFYTTTIERQARHWAWKRFFDVPLASRTPLTQPMILRFRVPLDELGNLAALHFVGGDFDDEPFWSLVHHCRQTSTNPGRTHNHPDPKRQGWYDIVTGPVADFWWQRSTMARADQVSFHTTAATRILDRLMASAQPGDFQSLPI
jgi:hypothetical protein